LGETVSPKPGARFENLKIEILENDRVMHSDLSSAILGNPLLSLCELVKLLAQQNLSLPTGSIVLAGAATAAIELKYGQKITATLETIGAVEFTVV
jgi:2-oxo-3-hexenedioate decarboxylase